MIHTGDPQVPSTTKGQRHTSEKNNMKRGNDDPKWDSDYNHIVIERGRRSNIRGTCHGLCIIRTNHLKMTNSLMTTLRNIISEKH